jgi:hypothetical protein
MGCKCDEFGELDGLDKAVVLSSRNAVKVTQVFWVCWSTM